MAKTQALKKECISEEELKEVSGGQLLPNSEGYYVFMEGDTYYDHGDVASCFIILKSKTTKNLNDTVYCKVIQSFSESVTSYRNISVSQLINMRKK